MANNKTESRIVWLVALMLLCSMALSSCFVYTPAPQPSEETKEDIYERIEQSEQGEGKRYDFVSDYLVAWKMPGFDEMKLKWAEQIFLQYYNYEGGFTFGSDETLARAIAVGRLFLDNVYDEIDITDSTIVTDGLIAALVAHSGDPYGVYRPPEESDSYSDDMSGKFGGIGVVVEYNHQDETIMISEVLIGSPAEKAGVEVGDFIYAVNDKTLTELGYLNAIDHVRGEIGVAVKLTMQRDGELIEFEIVREEVVENTVYYEILEGNYGYVRVSSFKSNTDDQFAEAIDALRSAGVKGVIFDMRNNLGGYVSSVVNMISYLVPSGNTVISYTYKTLPTETKKTAADGIYTSTGEPYDSVLDIPMVVLCNEYTASAAEIFTSALRDYNIEGLVKAVSVGTTTYKKGVMQAGFVYPNDQSSITLTVAYYNPPCGVNYHGIGITPDVISELTSDQDTQLEDAVKELKKLLNEN